MGNTDELAALSDPTRRRILESLAREGPRSVGELAATMAVSRPAVSQHLKVLSDAGLASVTAQGTRRIYSVDPAGLEAARSWLDMLWGSVLDHFAAAARRQEETMLAETKLDPVIKTRTVALDPAAAFELFTDGIGRWWPTGSHSIHGDDVIALELEGRIGGRLLEHTSDGRQACWAEVLAWDPPDRFVLSWHPHPAPVAASRLEVRFLAVAGGTEVVLEHSGWEEFGDEAATIRGQYEPGWDLVLAPFEHAAQAR